MSAHYVQTRDIVFNNTSTFANWGTTPPANVWVALGVTPFRFFTGSYDGRGHKISGLYNRISTAGAAFIYRVDTDAVVKNLYLDKCYFVGQKQSAGIAAVTTGATAFGAAGLVQNCGVSGYIGATGSSNEDTGGIVGQNNGNVEDCTNTAQVSSANARAGGIVGCNAGTVKTSVNRGAVTGAGAYIGGIAGFTGNGNLPGIIRDCYNTGAVTGSTQVGGIVGFHAHQGNGSVISNCFNAGAVTATATGGLAGAIAGQVSAGAEGARNTVANSYFNSTVLGTLPAIGSDGSPDAVKATNLAAIHALATADMQGDNAVTTMKLDRKIWRPTAVYPHFEGLKNGTGTPEDPYKIATWDDLLAMNYLTNDMFDVDAVGSYMAASYIQTADIVVNNASGFANWATTPPDNDDWSPLGVIPYRFFSGTYDGQGHSITGLYRLAPGAGSSFIYRVTVEGVV